MGAPLCLLFGVGRNEKSQLACSGKGSVTKRAVRMLRKGEEEDAPEEHAMSCLHDEAGAAEDEPADGKPDDKGGRAEDQSSPRDDDACSEQSTFVASSPASVSQGAVCEEAIEAVSIAAGPSFTLLVDTKGRVWGCGDGPVQSMMGGSGEEDPPSPSSSPLASSREEEGRRPIGRLTLVPFLSMFTVTRVSCGQGHSALTTLDGQLLTWGCNAHGQLGLGVGHQDVSYVPVPSVVSFSSSPSNSAHMAACGAHHTLLVSSSGGLLAAGWCQAGQLGLGVATELNAFSELREVAMSAVAGNVVAAAAGHAHSVAITSSGKVYEWGRGDYWWSYNARGGLWGMEDDYGAGGDGASGGQQERLKPKRVMGVKGTAVAVCCGYDHTVVLTADGGVWTWRGACGKEGASLPVRVAGALDGVKVSKVACGYDHSYALVEGGGGAFSWGRNHFGQLGCGAAEERVAPTRVACAQPMRVLSEVSAGCLAEHTVCGYSSRLSSEAALAFVMGSHPRLGGKSPLLALDVSVVAHIASI